MYSIAALEVAAHAPARVGLLREHVHARGQLVDVDARRGGAARRRRDRGAPPHAAVDAPEGWSAPAEARLALAPAAARTVALRGVALDLLARGASVALGAAAAPPSLAALADRLLGQWVRK